MLSLDLRADRPYNLHSHTQYCDGRNTMAEMAAEAVRLGFSHYGFSPHSPLPAGVESSCNMRAADVDAYIAEARRLGEQYAGQTVMLCSMEIDYLGPQWGPANSYFAALPLDYRIGSIHFLPTQDGRYVDMDGHLERFAERLQNDFRGDLDYVVDTYFRQSIAMVRSGGLDIIGHFDKIALNASALRPGIDRGAHYLSLLDELIEAIRESGITAEINTKAYEKTGVFFPSERHWGRLLDEGIPLVVNSDAHFVDRLESGRKEALEILKNVGLR